jgi:hypothetical protein
MADRRVVGDEGVSTEVDEGREVGVPEHH